MKQGQTDIKTSWIVLTRGSYSNQQFYKKSQNLTKYLVVYFVFVMYLKRGGKEGDEKGKRVVGKFSSRVVCQNIIPLSLSFNTFKETFKTFLVDWRCLSLPVNCVLSIHHPQQADLLALCTCGSLQASSSTHWLEDYSWQVNWKMISYSITHFECPSVMLWRKCGFLCCYSR